MRTELDIDSDADSDSDSGPVRVPQFEFAAGTNNIQSRLETVCEGGKHFGADYEKRDEGWFFH